MRKFRWPLSYFIFLVMIGCSKDEGSLSDKNTTSHRETSSPGKQEMNPGMRSGPMVVEPGSVPELGSKVK